MLFLAAADRVAPHHRRSAAGEILGIGREGSIGTRRLNGSAVSRRLGRPIGQRLPAQSYVGGRRAAIAATGGVDICRATVTDGD